MVTTLYLIRHGETEGSETKRYKGSLDVPLSPRGIGQVEETARFVAGHVREHAQQQEKSYLRDIHGSAAGEGGPQDRLTAVYSSDLSRAVKSAEIVAAPHGLIPQQMAGFRERSFGIWEGMSFTEIKEQYPAEFEAWAGNPVQFSPVSGESTLEVRERVTEALDAVIAAHEGGSLAVVAHGGVNRIILCHVMGVPLENIFRIEQDFAAVNVIEFWDRYPVVKLINGGFRG